MSRLIDNDDIGVPNSFTRENWLKNGKTKKNQKKKEKIKQKKKIYKSELENNVHGLLKKKKK